MPADANGPYETGDVWAGLGASSARMASAMRRSSTGDAGVGAGKPRQVDNSSDGIDKLWRDLTSAKDDPWVSSDRDAWLRDALGIRRQYSCLHDASIGLGAQLRWSLACNRLKETKGCTNEDLKGEFEMPREFLQLGTVEGVAESRLSTLASFARRESAVLALCKAIHSALDKDHHRPHTEADFGPTDFWAPAHGPNAVRNYRALMRTGVMAVASNGSLIEQRKHTTSPERQEAMLKLFAGLDRSHGGRPIQSVHMPGSPMQLCTVAHEILRHFENRKDDTRPVLLLPCSRLVPGHDYRGLDFLVHNLFRFFQQEPLTPHPPSLLPDEIAARVEAIRRDLALRPAIIVLVGYEVTRGDFAHLRRAIRDDPVHEFLAQFVHACVGDIDHPLDVDQFERSRFIVLADAPIDVLEEYCETSIEIPQPTRKDQYLDLLNARAPDFTSVASSVEKIAIMPNEAMVMGYVQLLSVERRTNQAVPSRLEELARYDTSDVLDRLTRTVRDRCTALDLLMLRIVAVAGAGVRRETLWRCVRLWSHAVADYSSGGEIGHLRPQIPQDEERDARIEALKTDFAFILAEGVDEAKNELDLYWHPYEYPDSPARTTGFTTSRDVETREPRNKRSTSIELRYSQVRDAILRDLDSEEEQWPRLLLHEIICIEALRQQTLVLRHAPAHKKSSVRSYQRALQTIYHGFLSLPAPDLWARMGEWPRCRVNGALPSEPINRFHFLYWSLFQKVLEEGGDRRMSREWAVDGVKRDILHLAHSAFRSPPTAKALPFAETPAWAVNDALAPRLASLLAEHHAAIAVVANRTNDLALWADLSAGIARAAVPTKKSSNTFSILERVQFDLAVLEYGPLAIQTAKASEMSIADLGVDATGFSRGPWYDSQTDATRVPAPEAFEAFVNDMEIQCRASPVVDRKALASRLARLADLRYQAIDYEYFRFRWRFSLEAVSMLLVVSRLLDSEFESDPAHSRPNLPPQGARVLARAGMEVLRLMNTPSKRMEPHSNVEGMTNWLAREVRRTMDWYTINYSTYMPDVVSMLVLEARFARTVGALTLDTNIRRHHVALHFLQVAEQRLAEFQPRPRLRIRFLIERCATLRGLAHESRKRLGAADIDANRYIALAKMDVIQLENIVETMFVQETNRNKPDVGDAWRRPIRHQRALTNAEAKHFS